MANPNIIEGMSAEEADRLLREMTGGDAPPPAPAPEPVEQAAPVDAPPAELVPEEQAPEPEPVEEPDWRAEAQRLAGELEETRRHAARGHSKADFLAKRLAEVTGGAAPADGTPESPIPEDRSDVELVYEQTAALAERQAALEAREAEREAQQAEQAAEALAAKREAIADEIITAGADDIRRAAVDADIVEQKLAQFREREEAVGQIRDPEEYRRAALALASVAVSEMVTAQTERRMAGLTARSAESSAAMKRAKISATITASGSTPSPRPQPRSYQDMSVKELDDWLRTNVPQ